MTAVLNKQYSQSVGGAGIGGYLNTALANKNGELVLPVILSGTMSHTVVTPDVQKIAEMKLNNIIPSAGGLLGTLLGGQGKQGQQGQQAGKPAQPSQQQQQLNSLQDAIGGLLGGKKKPPK